MVTASKRSDSGDSPLVEPISRWFREHGRDLPWREEGFTPWAGLVSEVMLQQTPVARVLEPLGQWLERWPDAGALAQASVADVVRAWGRLGYPRRALRLRECAIAIVERHGGVVPTEVEALLALPGIGDYTARAVAVFAHRQRHPVVDTNVRRVIARAVHGQADAAPPSARRDLADAAALLPEAADAAVEFSAAIMELGALVCIARTPRCNGCPVAELCAWRGAGYPAYDGPKRVVQAKFEGSDRQARGAVLAALRSAEHTVSHAELEASWSSTEQLSRAIDSLIADGLVEENASGRYRLPSSSVSPASSASSASSSSASSSSSISS